MRMSVLAPSRFNAEGPSISKGLLVPLLAAYFIVGGWLAVHRIFQVDEVQTMHMAWLLTQEDSLSYSNSAELYMLPMALLARAFNDPYVYMVVCRLGFFFLFISSILILGRVAEKNGGPRLFTGVFLIASLPVLWDYGFEVRHDNIIIFGLAILLWILFDAGTGGRRSRLYVGGLLGGLLLFSGFKSVLLWGPVLVYVVVICVRRRLLSYRHAFALVAGGLGTAGLAAAAAHWMAGSARIYIQTLKAALEAMGSDAIRFFDWDYTLRFVRYHPLIIVLGLIFLSLEIVPGIRGWLTLRAFDSNDSQAKRLFLFLLGLAFIGINPTPFPYNFMYVAVLLLPSVLFIFQRATASSQGLVAISLAGLLVVQFAFGVSRLKRHFYWSNRDQHKAIDFVNDFTLPSETVFDGAGMAMYRKGPGKVWYLHSLNIPSYRAGTIPSVRTMLAQEPSPLLVENYKWTFMDRDDRAFIASRYIPFRMAFWILGARIVVDRPGLFRFDIWRNGRYAVIQSGASKSQCLLIDGKELLEKSLFLTTGPHTLEANLPNGTVLVLWNRNPDGQFPNLPSPALPLFVNWY